MRVSPLDLISSHYTLPYAVLTPYMKRVCVDGSVRLSARRAPRSRPPCPPYCCPGGWVSRDRQSRDSGRPQEGLRTSTPPGGNTRSHDLRWGPQGRAPHLAFSADRSCARGLASVFGSDSDPSFRVQARPIGFRSRIGQASGLARSERGCQAKAPGLDPGALRPFPPAWDGSG